jgi:hypothetical protein
MSTTDTNKTQHTPGPWYVEHPFQEPGVYVASRSTRHHASALICKPYPAGDAHYDPKLQRMVGDDAQTEANARLIAAAPELLECLLMALPFVEDALDSEDFKPSYVRHRADLIRAAINKATGGTP